MFAGCNSRAGIQQRHFLSKQDQDVWVEDENCVHPPFFVWVICLLNYLFAFPSQSSFDCLTWKYACKPDDCSLPWAGEQSFPVAQFQGAHAAAFMANENWGTVPQKCVLGTSFWGLWLISRLVSRVAHRSRTVVIVTHPPAMHLLVFFFPLFPVDRQMFVFAGGIAR